MRRALQWWQIKHKHNPPEVIHYSDIEALAKEQNRGVVPWAIPKKEGDIVSRARYIPHIPSIVLYQPWEISGVSDQIHALFHELCIMLSS